MKPTISTFSLAYFMQKLLEKQFTFSTVMHFYNLSG
ncbi:hypothetical protein BB2000_2810 [Proteus mirabilis BB2000]|nr:hypothetical protein BB2000_2810 [Proteus mirabilis BB2000]